MRRCTHLFFFFFNDTATTEIYTLSLHDALPISGLLLGRAHAGDRQARLARWHSGGARGRGPRSEEHTSELQSQSNLVCRLLLEKKNSIYNPSQGKCRYSQADASQTRESCTRPAS